MIKVRSSAVISVEQVVSRERINYVATARADVGKERTTDFIMFSAWPVGRASLLRWGPEVPQKLWKSH